MINNLDSNLILNFNKIHDLEFQITSDWNMCLSIDLISSSSLISENLNVFICSFESSKFTDIKFTDIIEYCFDIFYEWYRVNSIKLDDVRDSIDFDDVRLGDITKRVIRDLKLSKLI